MTFQCCKAMLSCTGVWRYILARFTQSSEPMPEKRHLAVSREMQNAANRFRDDQPATLSLNLHPISFFPSPICQLCQHSGLYPYHLGSGLFWCKGEPISFEQTNYSPRCLPLQSGVDRVVHLFRSTYTNTCCLLGLVVRSRELWRFVCDT